MPGARGFPASFSNRRTGWGCAVLGGVTLLGLVLLPVPAWAGLVRTMDGRTLEGDVRLDNGQIVVVPRGAAPVRLDAADVLQVLFRDGPRAAAGAAAPASSASLPAAWKDQSIGPPTVANSAKAAASGLFTLWGGGHDIQGNADSFYYVYRPMSGDSEIEVCLENLSALRKGARAGIVIRDSLDRSSAEAGLLCSSDGALRFVHRRDFRAGVSGEGVAEKQATPLWLRLSRHERTVVGSYSTDGANWQDLGEQEVSLRDTVLAGMALCGRGGASAATASFDNVSVTTPQVRGDQPREQALGRSVVMRTGSTVANAWFQETSPAAGRIVGPDGRAYPVAVSDVARIIFRQVPQQFFDKLPPRATGAILGRGDFIEGEFRGFDGPFAKISSVLMGLVKVNCDNECSAVILGPVAPASTDWVVRCYDGSLFMGRSLKLDGGDLLVDDVLLGQVHLQGQAVAEIRAGPGRLEPISQIQPSHVQIPHGVDPAAAYAVDAPLGAAALSLDGGAVDAGLSLAAGVSLDYQLDGKYKVFLCRAGVPDNLLPTVPVRIVALADGTEVFRGPPCTSLDAAQSISLNLANVKTLTLRVEPAGAGVLPACAIFAEPVLVK